MGFRFTVPAVADVPVIQLYGDVAGSLYTVQLMLEKLVVLPWSHTVESLGSFLVQGSYGSIQSMP